MELVQLRLVRQVLEAGSLSKAAMRLNRAQSVVSRQLSALERECGGRIFYRNGRGVLLTEFGERVLPEIDAILDSARRITAPENAGKGAASGIVRLGMIPSVGRNLVQPLFTALRESQPDVRLRVVEGYSGDLDTELEEERLDVAVLLRPGTAIGKDDRVIGHWETYLVGLPGDAAVQQPSIAFASIEGLPLLLPAAPNASRDTIDELAFSAGIKLDIVAEVNAPTPTSRLLYGGAGYLIAPFGAGQAANMSWVGEDVRNGRLRAARIVDPPLTRTLVVSTAAVPRHSAEVVARQIVSSLREIAAE